jgi:membrane fusion protein (multidrug efflux system)
MASKAIYTVMAVAGIAVASGAAWWYQNKPARPAGEAAAAGVALAGAVRVDDDVLRTAIRAHHDGLALRRRSCRRCVTTAGAAWFLARSRLARPISRMPRTRFTATRK